MSFHSKEKENKEYFLFPSVYLLTCKQQAAYDSARAGDRLILWYKRSMYTEVKQLSIPMDIPHWTTWCHIESTVVQDVGM